MKIRSKDALDHLLSIAVPSDEVDRVELEPGVSFWRSSGQAPAEGLTYEALIPAGLHFGGGNARMTTVVAATSIAFRGYTATRFRLDDPLPCVSSTEPGTRWQSLGLWVETSADLFPTLSEGLGSQLSPEPATEALSSLINGRSTATFHGPARGYALRAEGYAMLALMHSDDRLTMLAPDTRRREAVRTARRILDDEYVDPPTLAELARRVGLNRRYLTGDFAAENGVSIARYITRLRLNHADAMLAAGVGATETALRVGLTPSHFAQAYKRRFGHPPSLRCPSKLPPSTT